MREILFRGKTPSGNWVEGFFLTRKQRYKGNKTFISEKSVISTGITESSGAYGESQKTIEYEVIPETVGQYTGLTDKNGKKIFEGDIFAHPDNKKYKYIVSWDDDVASFGWFNGDGMGFDNEEIEIIGNIHDNPELVGDTN